MTEPAERLRVLMVADVSPLAPAGGAERVLAEHARGLAARGHDVRVLARAPLAGVAPAAGTRSWTRTAASGELPGVEVRHVTASTRSVVHFAASAVLGVRAATEAWLAEHAADVLVVYQPVAGYGALGARGARGTPALYTFLSPAPLEYRSRRRMTRRHRGGLAGAAGALALWRLEAACLRRSRRISVLSEYSADQLWRLYRITDDRVTRIPGGVDVARFRPANDRGAVRAGLGLPTDRPVLLTVRNLEARMGLDTLLRAMARVHRAVPDALLVVGGVGSRRNDLAALASSLGLDGAVRWVGWIADEALPRWYQAADAFVLPTRDLEGFGLVTVEALASGTPVIGTAVGATPEILEPLEPSLLVAGDDDEALGARLGAFLAAGGGAAAARLRQAAREHAERHYSWPRAVAALEAELVSLARGGAPAPLAACPACGGRMHEASFAYRGRRYAACAGCATRSMRSLPDGAATRHRYQVSYPRLFAGTAGRGPLMATLIRRLGPAAPGARLLDVGGGGGDFVTVAATRGWRVAVADLAHAACAGARAAGVRAAQADAAALPFREASQDAVALVNVLDHTLEPARVLAEARRVLKPGGGLVVRVPNGAVHRPAAAVLGRLGPLARLRGWDRRPILHLHAFGARGLRAVLESAGFDVEAVRNSPPADRGVLRRVVATLATAAAVLTGGRWLRAPSIDAVARAPVP